MIKLKIILTISVLLFVARAYGQDSSSTTFNKNNDWCPIGKTRTTIHMGTTSYVVDIKDACLTDAEIDYYYNEIHKSSCLETGSSFYSFDKNGGFILEQSEDHTWDDEKGCIIKSYKRLHGECVFCVDGCIINDIPNIKLEDVIIDGKPLFPLKPSKPKPVKQQSYALWYIIVSGLAVLLTVAATMFNRKNNRIR